MFLALSIVASAQTTQASSGPDTSFIVFMASIAIWFDFLAVLILLFAAIAGRKVTGKMSLKGMNAKMEDWGGLPQVIVGIGATTTLFTVSIYAIENIIDIIK